MFAGFVQLGSTITGAVLTRNASTQVPTDAASPPTFRIYGPSGLMANGTGTASLLDSSNTDGLYSWSYTPAGANGFAAGVTYTILFQYTVSAVVQAQIVTFTVT